jgi:hypothetical protein
MANTVAKVRNAAEEASELARAAGDVLTVVLMIRTPARC